ncbi:hypothetical protein ADIARSV_1489 [Arcticibacter svalbardensis MN12-7]|uniref:LPS export ABC transporter periplasmic protein LptC n=1 Tax=Arcticibacter svalbardensis MN12-7 TaxID=1150600 RepID=R9GTZ8_9SPHI|nr:LPS export ABC transporter periplasmic protein LptC [Arcticibacter svalbardensis]EOR95337.1 hypothetical protein ADIARSV_1489 [Arcticibacter svalbardensis MN12-7]
MKSIKTWASVSLLICFFFSSCENDLKDVEKVSADNSLLPVDKSYGVEVIYSDSAVVKAKMLAPQVDRYKEQQYDEMVKGVTIIFYDANQKETSRIVSDYAIRREAQQIVELRKNVVATNIKGDVYKSDELIWDEKQHKFYSNKLVQVNQKNGNVLFGTSFESDEAFKKPRIFNATGNFPSGGNLVN